MRPPHESAETTIGFRINQTIQFVPFTQEDGTEPPSLSVSILDGPALILWSIANTTEGETEGVVTLFLQRDETVVIGRQEGGRIDYLDARYQPTQLMPKSFQGVVGALHDEADRNVSRGHFMLKGKSRGILLVNGVPRPNGEIRPPVNGTVILEPHPRLMGQGEGFLIERGASLKILLPNGSVILLRAD